MSELVLSMIVRNEADVLAKTLPVVAPCFERKVALDTGSTDGTQDMLRAAGFEVHSMEWGWDYSAARNRLIEILESKTDVYWTIMLDADEAMWPVDLIYINSLHPYDLSALEFPRFNLIYDYQHWEAHSYPDFQTRAFCLDRGYRFRNKLHETLSLPDGTPVKPMSGGSRHIYHYGSCKPIKQVWLKHHNYVLLLKGEPPLPALPEHIAAMPDDEFKLIYNAAAKAPSKFDQPHPLQ